MGDRPTAKKLVLHQQGARGDSLATHGVCEDKRLLKPGSLDAQQPGADPVHRRARTRGPIYWRLTQLAL